ncbi:MAG: four helix bundle protein [Bacteroidetes bacterium]|nr:four helix bundle protein [Bacteroidota bacterium]
MQTNKENIIIDITFNFSIDIINYCKKLEENRQYNIGNQLFRCGTSIGVNVREAQNTESKIDFIHKLKIAAKEADETEYWLQICNQLKDYPNTTDLLVKIESIQKILSKIISSSKQSSNYQTIKSSN